MKKARHIKPENLTNYILGILTESGASLFFMFFVFILGAILLKVLKG